MQDFHFKTRMNQSVTLTGVPQRPVLPGSGFLALVFMTCPEHFLGLRPDG